MFRPLLILLLAGTAASAQIVTDRPDFTESAVAVPPGRVQIEAGVTASEGADALDLSGPEALVRWGLAPRVEARIGLPDYLDAGSGAPGGFGDPSLGVKVEFARLAGWDFAAIAEVSLPLGDDARSGPASPLAIVIAGRDIGALSFGTQAEVAWDRATDRVEVGGTAVVGAPLAGAVGAFVEVAAASTPSGTAILAHHGYTLSLTPDVQLDAHIGAGLTDAAPDLLGGVGVSVRL